MLWVNPQNLASLLNKYMRIQGTVLCTLDYEFLSEKVLIFIKTEHVLCSRIFPTPIYLLVLLFYTDTERSISSLCSCLER